jgi:hypothetical protein
MIHPDESSGKLRANLNMLKTIKSELEDEEESVNLNFEQQEQPSARINQWGMKIPNFHPSETESSAE